MGRAYRRPPSWRLPAALAALGVLLIGAGAGFGVAELTHKHHKKKKPISLTPSRPLTPTTTAPTTAPPTTTSTQTAPTTAPPTTTTAPPTGGTASLTTWPAGSSGWTVVLLEINDRGQARARARDAARHSISAGVLRGSDYAGFNRGTWIAFAGQYPRRAAAARAEKRYAKKGFPGNPRFVKPRSKTKK